MHPSQTQFFTIGKTVNRITIPTTPVVICDEYKSIPAGEIEWATKMTRYRQHYTKDEYKRENFILNELKTWSEFGNENFYFIHNETAADDIPIFYLTREAVAAGHTTAFMQCEEFRIRVPADLYNRREIMQTICLMMYLGGAKYQIIGGRFDTKDYVINKVKISMLRVWIYFTGDRPDFETSLKDLLAPDMHKWLDQQDTIRTLIKW